MKRGQSPASAIPMTVLQLSILKEQKNRQNIGVQTLVRIQILLSAQQGQSNSQVKRDLGVSLNTVKTWRRRWLSAYKSLLIYESKYEKKAFSLSAYKGEILQVLQNLPRSGAPKRITLDQEQQIIALACEEPEKHGLELTDWTHEMLAKTAIAKGIIDRISPAQTGRILKKKSSSTS
jgi:transposase